MATRSGSKGQPQTSSQRQPLTETISSATNRQLSTSPKKALSEHKTASLASRQPPIPSRRAASNKEKSSSARNHQSSIVSPDVTPENGPLASASTCQTLATPQNTAPESEPRNLASARQHPVESQEPTPSHEANDPAANCEPSTTSHNATAANANPAIPHHESLHPSALLQNVNGVSHGKAIGDRRIAAIADEARQDAKRDSAASHTSTDTGLYSKKIKRFIGPWQLGRDLGQGSTGRVRLARHRLTGHLVAMKIVNRRAARAMQSQSLMNIGDVIPPSKLREKMIPVGIEREIIMMRLLCHPNVLKLFDVWENRGELYLVLEFVEGGELYTYIRDSRRLKEGEAVRIFRQIISGLAHLHRYSICHRDLKPENILLDEHGNIKIADFGMAALQPGNQNLNTHCGSPHYAAPEIARSLPYRGTLADIWSLGVILFVMLNGHMPFSTYKDNERTADVLDAVIKGDVFYPEWNSEEAVHLMRMILQQDPEKRITIKDMWRHPLLRKWEPTANHPKAKTIWLGGPPVPLSEDECGKPLSFREDIDPEILRNLKILCHSISEEDLIECLMEAEPNVAKVFYQCLLKYREEALEYYSGPSVKPSRSDYHHGIEPPLPKSSSRLSVATSNHQRRASQFSIPKASSLPRQKSLPSRQSRQAGTESRQSRQASKAGTEKSYDPYKYSRRPKSAEAEYAKITVLARSMEESRRLRTPSHASSLLNPAIAKYHDQESVGIPSSPPALPIPSSHHHDRQGSQSSAIMLSRNQSRSSFVSSYHRRSSSRGIRSSMSYKRGVSFNHVRHRSRGDSIPSRARAPSPDTMLNRYLNDQTTPSEDPSLPTLISEQFRDLHEPPSRPAARLDHRRRSKDLRKRYSKAMTQLKKEDLEQFSSEASELERMMEETFARTSLTTAATTEQDSYQEVNLYSADTSLSLMNDLAAKLSSGDRLNKSSSKDQVSKSVGKRPLPKPSGGEAGLSDAQVQLIKARDTFMERLNDPNMPLEVINETLVTLNRLVQQHIPGAETATHKRYSIIDLSPVKEESVQRDSWRTILSTPTKRISGNRTVSEPLGYGRRGNDMIFQRSTIRLVDDDPNGPLSPIKPLNIRKRSDEGVTALTRPPSASLGKRVRNSTGTQRSNSQLSNAGSDHRHTLDPFYNPANRDSHGSHQARSQHNLAPIHEDGYNNKENRDPYSRSQDAKKGSGSSSWFKRTRNNSNSTRSSGDQRQGERENPNWPLRDREIEDVLQTQQQRRSTPLEGFAPPKPKTSAKDKLLKLFGKKSSEAALKGPEHANAFGLAPPDEFLDEDEESNFASSPRYPPPSRAGLRSSSTLAGSASQGQQRPPTRRGAAGVKRDDESLYPPTLHPSQQPVIREPPAQNWLAKFLHIKPASRTICFRVSRVQARKQVVAALRGWRRYGMRDIVVDRGQCRVWARVGVDNSLAIRPVSIRIEIFTVLDRGRQANLAIARVTQEEGSKSSFERVVDSLVGVLGTKDLLVRDEKWVKEMKACLG